jgi:3',5'-cyclic AMP phosphodiesterase CpdA
MVAPVGEEGSSPRVGRRSRRLAILAFGLITLGASAVAWADHGSPDTLGHTTLEQRIVAGSSDPGFRQLELGGGSGPYLVRQDGVGSAAQGREGRRTSLAYFGQLSDFQLADEESPARVEFLDSSGGPFTSAFRPWEALNPHIDDAMIRQINAFAGAAPVADGNGSRRAMDFTITTGDSADSQQHNETLWVKQLLEGGPIQPNSGTDPDAYPEHPLCDELPVPDDLAEAAGYTGVQDYDDYDPSQTVPPNYFYDPDDPAAPNADWPEYAGLMDEAQEEFPAEGLAIPSYLAFGNHDALVQGSIGANSTFEAVATGCIKPLTGTLPDGGNVLTGFTVAQARQLYEDSAEKTILVPPDQARRFVSKAEYKQIFKQGGEPNGHGFNLIDTAEESASKGAAGYYSFSPVQGVRMIAMDTVSEGGFIATAANGNLDHPQFEWLERELRRASAAEEVVILFSHHAPASMTSNTPDEFAPPCTAVDHEDDPPGCDLDPRNSRPVHVGPGACPVGAPAADCRDDVIAMLHRYPHVLGWVAGHSHVNRVEPFARKDGGGFWVVRVAAEADWPQQSRLLQLFDNRDGTLSLFGTILDHASPATAPDDGTSADGLDPEQLASIGRTLAYNDSQSGARACSPTPCGEGSASDRNVELLAADPRGPCANPRRGTGGRDALTGTVAGDRLLGLAGRDRLVGLAGRDCLLGGPGADRLLGNPGDDRLVGGAGADRLFGGPGGDRLLGGAGGDRLVGGPGRDRVVGGSRRDLLVGGPGRDRLVAGPGSDLVRARDGVRDLVRCGPGKRDVAIVDRRDRVRGCEIVRRAGRRRR